MLGSKEAEEAKREGKLRVKEMGNEERRRSVICLHTQLECQY